MRSMYRVLIGSQVLWRIVLLAAVALQASALLPILHANRSY